VQQLSQSGVTQSEIVAALMKASTPAKWTSCELQGGAELPRCG